MKKFSKEDLTRLAERVRAELGSAEKYGTGFTDATIDTMCEKSESERAIEKENQEGLRIGKYDPHDKALPISGSIDTYTGFRFTETPGLFSNPKPRQTYLLDWSWTTIPWYARLLGIARLPYDLGKFIVTGRLIVIPWPWRW